MSISASPAASLAACPEQSPERSQDPVPPTDIAAARRIDFCARCYEYGALCSGCVAALPGTPTERRAALEAAIQALEAEVLELQKLFHDPSGDPSCCR